MVPVSVKSAFVSMATILEPIFHGFALMADNMDLISTFTAVLAGSWLLAKGYQIAIATYQAALITKKGVELGLENAITAAKISAAATNPFTIALALAALAAGAVYLSRAPKGRAIGGPVAAGEPYMVGEKGPELIVPTTSANVIPNDQLNQNNQNRRSDAEIVSLATKAAARSISVDFNTPKFNSINSLDAVFA